MATQYTTTTTRTMRAVTMRRYDDVAKAKLETDVPVPEPAAGQMRVKVLAAGVDPGVWHIATGKPYMARLVLGLTRPSRPILGTDVVGVVDAVGSGVTKFKTGDVVMGNTFPVGTGSFAEFALVAQDVAVPKPPQLSNTEAAALPVSGCTALLAVQIGEVQAGQTVCVLGAGGGVGHLAVQIAKSKGATVTGVCSAAKADLVKSVGADDVIDYTKTDLTKLGRKWDVVIDNAGRRSFAELDAIVEPSKGVGVIVGGDGGGNMTGGFLERIAGAAWRNKFTYGRQKYRPVDAPVTAPLMDELAKLVGEGKLKPAVTQVFDLESAKDAVVAIGKGHVGGKTVVEVVKSS